MDILRLEILKRRLRERLAIAGLSAREASRRSGLGLSYVDDILCGLAVNVRMERIESLATTLGCQAGWLAGDDQFGGDDERTMRVARAIEGECRDLPHAMRVARLAIAAAG